MDNLKPEPGETALSGRPTLAVCADGREREQLVEYLCGWGMNALGVATALEGLVALRQARDSDEPISLVLYNPRGQEATGEQFAVIARSDPKLRSAVFVHLGQPIDSAHDMALRKSGFTALVGEPVDKTLLFDALHKIYSPYRGGDAVARLLDRYTALGPSTPPLDILVAEPSTTQRGIIRYALERGGHRIYEVENGEQALDALDGHGFDVVLIDLDLPGIGGAEAARLFHFARAQEDWPAFIALAAQAGTAQIRDCRREGVAAIVEKPVRPQALARTIAAVIRRRQGLAEQPMRASISEVGPNASRLPLIDEKILAELDGLGAGTGFLAQLVNEFIAEVESLVGQVRDTQGLALAYPRFLDLGHALKDSAGNLGALRLYELGLIASHLPEPVFDQEGERLLARIDQALDDSRIALSDYLERRGQSFSPG